MRALKILIAILIMGGSLYWISSHSMLEIVVTTSNDSNITYELTKQPSGKTNQTMSGDKTIKKIVSKGEYEIAVKQGSGGFFTTARTRGFLSKTVVDAKLSSEKVRQFVGDNPAECMFYSKLLYSYSCSNTSPFSEINVHLPANEQTPTYSTKIPPSPIDGALESLIKSPLGNLALVRPLDIEGSTGHLLFALDDNLRPLNSRRLAELNVDSSYQLVSYKAGFLAYNLNESTLFYYDSFYTDPQKISFKNPTGELRPVTLGVNNDVISILFSNRVISDGEGIDQLKDIKNTLLIDSNGNQSEVDLSGQAVHETSVCGQSLICVLGEEQFLIYRVTGEEKQIIYSVGDVRRTEVFGDSVILVRTNEILRINTKTIEGSLDYSFDDYKYCGLQKIDEQNYIICVADIENRKKALMLSNGSTSDDIDKKILQLQKLDEVDAVSAYKNLLYVMPNLGEPTYDAVTKSFMDNPETKTRVNNKINEEIQKLGIDTKKYTIVNTSE